MTEHTFETHTWCIGRFLVDVPVQFEIRPTSHSFDGVEVTALGAGTADDLKRIVQSRISELKSGVEKDGLALRFVDSWTEQIAIVVSYDIPVVKIKTTTEEAYTLSEGHMFMSQARIVSNVVGDTRVKDHAALMRVSQAVRPRVNDEIPEGVGACIEDAFVALPRGQESIRAAFLDADVDDFGFELGFKHYANTTKSRTAVQLKTIGTSSREIAGYSGREGLIVRRGETASKSGLRFLYSGGLDAPVGGSGIRISAKLWKNYARPDDLPYDEATSRAIWNGVLNSIKERGAK